MEKKVIKVPQKLNLDEALNFYREIDNLEIVEGGEYSFDFSALKYTCPFSLLLVSDIISDFFTRVKKRNGNVYARNYGECNYQGHMGFFKSFGLDFGKKPGEAKGGGNYLPITVMNVDRLKQQAAIGNLHIGELIEKVSRKLSKVLIQVKDEDDDGALEAMTYILREVMRNVVEHSKSERILYCAQYYPSQDRAEISIMDKGVGICNSLKHNPHLEIKNDFHALQLSLMPGVSGKSFKGAKVQNKNEWTNTGYGLYMVSRICRNNGNFFIVSGNAGIYLGFQQKIKNNFKFNGTIIRLVIHPQKITNIRKTLENYREEGKLISKDIEGAMTIPSTASMMLTSDFKNRKSIMEKIREIIK
jgi:hypothetical protein